MCKYHVELCGMQFRVHGPEVEHYADRDRDADCMAKLLNTAFAAGFAAGVEVGMRRRAKASLKRKGKR